MKRKTLKNKLDTVFSLKIRERGRCERCGTTERLQCSHIFSRSNLSVRWDEDNAFCLCSGCHIFWWHKNPIEAGEFTREKLGEEKYKILRAKAQAIKKWTDLELSQLYLTLCRTQLTSTSSNSKANFL